MASATDLPVDLVEDIFLRLDDAADVVRASAACAAFRRVVSDSRFLRRFRSMHRRPVLGLLSSRVCSASRALYFYPAAPPRRTAQAARAIARAAGFSSSFLPVPADPTEHCWHVHDARDGRVLLCLSRRDSDDDDATCLSFSNLVVYDPLHRKHVQIPPIPKDIVACTCSLQQGCSCGSGSDCNCECGCEFDPFLAPAADDEDDLSFRVMCTVLSTDMEYNDVLQTFIYSSVTGKWCGVASLSDANYKPLQDLSSMERHYAHGCFYWVDVDSYQKDMLMLDMNEMKFSVVRLPSRINQNEFKIVVKAAEEDRIGLLVLRGNTLHLYSKAFCSANDSSQWRHDDVVTLLDSYEWFFGGAADQGYALLQGIPRDEYWAWRCSPEEMRPKTNAHYFTVELQTLLVEQLCVAKLDTEPAFLYASFPPPFAPPCI